MKKKKTQVGNSRNSDAILSATRELLKERGYQAVSVRDICQRAEVSRSSFYSVFSSKDDVIVSMIRSLKENTDVVLTHFITAENDLERIWRLYDIYIDVGLEFGPSLMESLLHVDLQNSIGFIDQFYLYNDWFSILVKNCQQKGIIQNKNDHTALVNAAVYSTFGIVFEWCRRNGDFDLREACFTAHEAIYNIHPDYRGLWKKRKESPTY